MVFVSKKKNKFKEYLYMKKFSGWMKFVLVLIVLDFIFLIAGSVESSKDDYAKQIVTKGDTTEYPSDTTIDGVPKDTCKFAVNYVNTMSLNGSTVSHMILLIIIFGILYHYAS